MTPSESGTVLKKRAAQGRGVSARAPLADAALSHGCAISPLMPIKIADE